MTNTLAPRNGTHAPPAVTALRLNTLDEAIRLGELLARTNYFKDVRDAGQAVAKILYGAELGIPAMAAMMGIHIIEGKPAPSATLIGALIKRSGRYNYRVLQHTAQECVLEFFERGESVGTTQFSMVEADHIMIYTKDGGKKKLTDKDTWRNYPAAMLFARALTAGARMYCPDVFGGAPVYSAEELGADTVATEDVAGEARLLGAGDEVDTATGEIYEDGGHEAIAEAAQPPIPPREPYRPNVPPAETVGGVARPEPTPQHKRIKRLMDDLGLAGAERVTYLLSYGGVRLITALSPTDAATVEADLTSRLAQQAQEAA